MTLCSLVGVYKRSRRIRCLHLQGINTPVSMQESVYLGCIWGFNFRQGIAHCTLCLLKFPSGLKANSRTVLQTDSNPFYIVLLSKSLLILHNVISEGDTAEDSSLLAHDTESGGATHPMTQPHISEHLHLHQTLLCWYGTGIKLEINDNISLYLSLRKKLSLLDYFNLQGVCWCHIVW